MLISKGGLKQIKVKNKTTKINTKKVISLILAASILSATLITGISLIITTNQQKDSMLKNIIQKFSLITEEGLEECYFVLKDIWQTNKKYIFYYHQLAKNLVMVWQQMKKDNKTENYIWNYITSISIPQESSVAYVKNGTIKYSQLTQFLNINLTKTTWGNKILSNKSGDTFFIKERGIWIVSWVDISQEEKLLIITNPSLSPIETLRYLNTAFNSYIKNITKLYIGKRGRILILDEEGNLVRGNALLTQKLIKILSEVKADRESNIIKIKLKDDTLWIKKFIYAPLELRVIFVLYPSDFTEAFHRKTLKTLIISSILTTILSILIILWTIQRLIMSPIKTLQINLTETPSEQLALIPQKDMPITQELFLLFVKFNTLLEQLINYRDEIVGKTTQIKKTLTELNEKIKELKQAQKEKEILAKLINSLIEIRDIQLLKVTAFKTVYNIFGNEYSLELWELDEKQKVLLKTTMINQKSIRDILPYDEGITGYVIKTQKPYYTEDTQKDPYYKKTTLEEVRSEYVTPIKYHQKIYGVIVLSKKTHKIPESVRKTTDLIATIIATAWNNAESWLIVEKYLSELKGIRQLCNLATSKELSHEPFTINEFLSTLKEYCKSATEMRLWLYDDGELKIFGDINPSENIDKKEIISHIEKAIKTKEKFFMIRTKYSYKMFACVYADQKSWAFIEAKLNKPEVTCSDIFKEISLKLLSVYIQEINTANTYNDTVKKLLNLITEIIEEKESCMKGHAKNTALISTKIAQEIGLPEKQIKDIYLGALVHDIGKLKIPAKILNKKEKLTEEEYEIIKKHPKYGAEILQGIKGLEEIAIWVRQHHEWVNKKGYPEGIDIAHITLPARIIHIAEAIEVMLRNLPYKKAKNVKEIADELQEKAGSQFDPHIVNAIIPILTNIIEEIKTNS